MSEFGKGFLLAMALILALVSGFLAGGAIGLKDGGTRFVPDEHTPQGDG